MNVEDNLDSDNFYDFWQLSGCAVVLCHNVRHISKITTRVAEPSFFCNYPLKYFLVSLPFALVYFSHILFSKEKVSLRFTQDLSSLAAVLRLSPVSLLFFASDWTGAIVLLILKYSVHLMIYGMATAVILDTTVSFVKKALSMRNYRWLLFSQNPLQIFIRCDII